MKQVVYEMLCWWMVGSDKRVLVILVREIRTCRAADLAGLLHGKTELGKFHFHPTCEDEWNY